MYCKYDKNTKKCLEVGTGTNTEFYKSIGMVDMEVEQAYDGSYYLKGYAPNKTDEQRQQEQAEKELAELNAKIDQLKTDWFYAEMTNDTEQIERIKTEYNTLMGV